jgi:hypothetical protein
VAGAAALIAALTLLARLAGFGRTLVFTNTVGAGSTGDVYLAANNVPNIVFEVVAGGALASLVVPMLAGGIALGQLAPARRRGTTMYALFVANTACGALLGLSPWYAGAAALQVVRGFCIGFGITLWDTMVMQHVPQHMLARVISMDWFGSIGLLPAGLGIWAVLSGMAAPGTLIAASSAFCTALFLLGLSNRRIRMVQ